MRAVLKPFFIHAAYSLIKTVVFLFSTIKHSVFFALSCRSVLRPSRALLRRNEWVNFRNTFWHHMKAKYFSHASIVPLELPVQYLLGSVHRLLEDFIITFDRLIKSSPLHGDVEFKVEAKQTEVIDEIRGNKWIAYAAITLVVRFWGLADKVDFLDVVLILAIHVLMHTIFLLLFHRSCRLGSNLWLSSAVSVSSVFALLLSLRVAMWFRILMDPVVLTEAFLPRMHG
ncbi:hypothetical protein F5051DRAFT_445212 [Lentinula edodes]|nr:hypothetical protein F5051DRAFT_445212 [Lentinula edodes]